MADKGILQGTLHEVPCQDTFQCCKAYRPLVHHPKSLNTKLHQTRVMPKSLSLPNASIAHL